MSFFGDALLDFEYIESPVALVTWHKKMRHNLLAKRIGFCKILVY